LRIANQTAEDVLIVSVEVNAESAEIARQIHQHAGVTNRIHIVVEPSNKAIPRLRDQFKVDAFDLIFIDHFKDLYLSDFKLLEQEGLMKQGTTIVADNVICPGAPDYLEYVRNNPQYSSTFYESTIEYRDDIPDGMEITVRL
jgi:catechol O-methyltransferase